MQNSRLISMMRGLSAKEVREFGRFIRHCGYFNANQNVTDLFDYLRKFHPDFDSDKLNQGEVFKRLFPKATDDSKAKRYIRDLRSDLSLLLEDYLVLKQTDRKHHETGGINRDRQYLLMKAFKDRNRIDLYQGLIDEFMRDLERSPERDMYFYYHLFKLNHLIYSHPATNKIARGIDSLHETMRNLDLFYCAVKLNYYCEMINRQNILNVHYDEPPLIEEVRKLTTQSSFKDEKLFRVYNGIVRLLQNQDDEACYFSLKKTLLANIDIFPDDEKMEMLTYLRNYCTYARNAGKLHFAVEHFEINDLLLKYNDWKSQGFISNVTFVNVVEVGYGLKKFEWTDRFIEAYAPLLNESLRDNAVQFCQGLKHYVQEDFEKARDTFEHLTIKENIYYKLRAMALLLRCYYELPEGQDFLIDRFFARFRSFLRYQDILNEAGTRRFLHLIKYTDKLIRVSRIFDRQERREEGEKIKADLAAEEHLSARLWLKQKAGAIQL